MQRHVNRSGIGVLERRFVKDTEQYANAIRDRSPDGRGPPGTSRQHVDFTLCPEAK